MHVRLSSFRRLTREKLTIRPPLGPEHHFLMGPSSSSFAEVLSSSDLLAAPLSPIEPRLVLIDQIVRAAFSFGSLAAENLSDPIAASLSRQGPRGSTRWALLTSMHLPRSTPLEQDSLLKAIFHYLDLLSLREHWKGSLVALPLHQYHRRAAQIGLDAYIQQLQAGALPEEGIPTSFLRSARPLYLQGQPQFLPGSVPTLLLQRVP